MQKAGLEAGQARRWLPHRLACLSSLLLLFAAPAGCQRRLLLQSANATNATNATNVTKAAPSPSVTNESSPSEAAAATSVFTEIPGFGSVERLHSQEFPLPSADVLRTAGFSYSLSEDLFPGFGGVGVNIPPSAWPDDERRNPRISVLGTVDTSGANKTDVSLTQVGPLVDFAPGGIKFLKPITLMLPVTPPTPASQMPGCECTGENAALGAAELAKHGADYGKYCAAWEDGVCTPSAKAAWRSGAHTCAGTNASSCQAHWPARNFSLDQSWCCDSWCYVNATSCTPDLQAKYGISLEDSWTGKALQFSYGVCPDPFSGPTGLADVQFKPASYSQYNKSTCPYAKAPAPAGAGAGAASQLLYPPPKSAATIIYTVAMLDPVAARWEVKRSAQACAKEGVACGETQSFSLYSAVTVRDYENGPTPPSYPACGGGCIALIAAAVTLVLFVAAFVVHRNCFAAKARSSKMGGAEMTANV